MVESPQTIVSQPLLNLAGDSHTRDVVLSLVGSAVGDVGIELPRADLWDDRLDVLEEVHFSMDFDVLQVSLGHLEDK